MTSSSSNPITQTEIDNLPPPPISWIFFSSSSFKTELKLQQNKISTKLKRCGYFITNSYAENYYTCFFKPKQWDEKRRTLYSPILLKIYNNINKTKTNHKRKNLFDCSHEYLLDKDDLQEWCEINKIKYKKSSSYKILAELFLQNW